MPVTRAFPDAVTTVDDTEQYDLGTEWIMSAEEVAGLSLTNVTGPCIWRYVKCSAEAEIGEIVGRDTGLFYTGANTSASTANGALGAAQFTIGANKYGWVLRKGIGNLVSHDTGNDQQDATLALAGSVGRVDAATTAGKVVGFGLRNAGASAGATFQAVINIL